jgi:hypothetical protein
VRLAERPEPVPTAEGKIPCFSQATIKSSHSDSVRSAGMIKALPSRISIRLRLLLLALPRKACTSSAGRFTAERYSSVIAFALPVPIFCSLMVLDKRNVIAGGALPVVNFVARLDAKFVRLRCEIDGEWYRYS